MSTYYYGDAQQKTIGPLSFDELKNLARAGTIIGATPVIEHGGAQWKTWTEIESAQQPKPAAAATALPASDRSQASPSPIAWGAMFFALLLVILQFLVLPATVIRNALVDLSQWGKEGRLPSSVSEFPVLTFLVVVLRPFVIIVYLIVALLWLIIMACAGSDYGMEMSYGTRTFLLILGCIGVYFYTSVIALIYDLLSLGIRVANNVKKLADKV
jgi:hypothetical protein